MASTKYFTLSLQGFATRRTEGKRPLGAWGQRQEDERVTRSVSEHAPADSGFSGLRREDLRRAGAEDDLACGEDKVAFDGENGDVAVQGGTEGRAVEG